MDELTQRIHALPPEIFNNIYELTFTAEPTVHKIGDNALYKPSVLLAIDRASRRRLASSYYGPGSTFYIAELPLPGCGNLRKWLATLTCDHQRLLNDIKIGDVSLCYRTYPAKLQRRFLKELKRINDNFIEDKFPCVRKEVLHVGIVVDYKGTMVWSNDPPTASELDDAAESDDNSLDIVSL